MTIQKMREADELIRKIKSANSVLDSLCDKDGNPKEKDEKVGALLSKLFTEFRNVSTESYKSHLAVVAFDAIVAAVREDISNLEKEFDAL